MKCAKDGCPEDATTDVTAEGMKREWDLCADHALEAINLGALIKLRVTAEPLAPAEPRRLDS